MFWKRFLWSRSFFLEWSNLGFLVWTFLDCFGVGVLA